MSLAVPQVITQRVLRMASAGASPSARDRKEFTLMGTEKVLAFYQSWAAMAMEMFRMQMSLAQAFTATSMSPLMQGPRPMDVSKAAAAGVRVLAAGLTPVHGKAVANARRLARRRR